VLLASKAAAVNKMLLLFVRFMNILYCCSKNNPQDYILLYPKGGNFETNELLNPGMDFMMQFVYEPEPGC